MSPIIDRQSFSNSMAPKLPLLQQPFQKVLETICINCKLGDTPLTKTDYVKLAEKVSKSGSEVRDINIAYILRSLVDWIFKEKKLLNFLENELGYLVIERMFKNSTKYIE